MSLILTEQQLKYRYSLLPRNQTQYEQAVYKLYTYLINEDGTELVFPKPGYQRGEFANLFKTCGFKNSSYYLNNSRKIRHTTVKLLRILFEVLKENNREDKLKLVLESKIIDAMLDATEDEEELEQKQKCIIS